jgi:hypothetical protein
MYAYILMLTKGSKVANCFASLIAQAKQKVIRKDLFCIDGIQVSRRVIAQFRQVR